MSSRPVRCTVIIPKGSGSVEREYEFDIKIAAYMPVSWLLSESIRLYDQATFGDDPAIIGLLNTSTSTHLDLSDDCSDCINDGDLLVAQGFTPLSTEKTRQTKESAPGVVRPEDPVAVAEAAAAAAAAAAASSRRGSIGSAMLERVTERVTQAAENASKALEQHLPRRGSGNSAGGGGYSSAGLSLPSGLGVASSYDLWAQPVDGSDGGGGGGRQPPQQLGPQPPGPQPLVPMLGTSFSAEADAPKGGRGWGKKRGPRLPASFMKSGGGAPAPAGSRSRPSPAQPAVPLATAFSADADAPKGGRGWGKKKGPRLPESFLRTGAGASARGVPLAAASSPAKAARGHPPSASPSSLLCGGAPSPSGKSPQLLSSSPPSGAFPPPISPLLAAGAPPAAYNPFDGPLGAANPFDDEEFGEMQSHR